jgi:hypothetical protein
VVKHTGIGFVVVGLLLFLTSCGPDTRQAPAPNSAKGTATSAAKVAASKETATSTTGTRPSVASIQVVTVHVPELKERLELS